MQTGVVVVADGKSTDGSPLCPFKRTGSISAVQRLIKTFQNAGTTQIVVTVQSDRLQKMEKHLAHWGTVCLDSKEIDPSGAPDLMGEGLRFLAQKCNWAFMIYVDTPFVMPETIRALLDGNHTLACPTFQGQVGMPLLLASSRISDFLNQRKILGKMGVHADWEMPVEDEGVLPCHPFTPRYERLAQRSRALRIYPFIKVSLYRENRFFGPGVAQLLELIETYESVRLACQQMGISYSKGWKILTVMEHELDTAIVNRQQGGRNGGTASLTEEGKQLLIKFRELEVRCREFSERAFNEIFHQELEE